MNIVTVYKRFPTQSATLRHLEKIRWPHNHKKPPCPYCGSLVTYRHKERTKLRYQCSNNPTGCGRSFSVTVGTIFHNTHIPLQHWFLLITLMLSARKGISSYQAARALQMRRPTVWSMMHRIRKAMEEQDDAELLTGIIEMDECYIGGKFRRPNKRSEDVYGGEPTTRGKGTTKTPIVGLVERGGRVRAFSVDKLELRAEGLRDIINKHLDPARSHLITDQYPPYGPAARHFMHTMINHNLQYVAPNEVHTNTIESFWAIVKRGLHGQYHRVSNKYLDQYLDEFCYRYNARRADPNTTFNQTLQRLLARRYSGP